MGSCARGQAQGQGQGQGRPPGSAHLHQHQHVQRVVVGAVGAGDEAGGVGRGRGGSRGQVAARAGRRRALQAQTRPGFPPSAPPTRSCGGRPQKSTGRGRRRASLRNGADAGGAARVARRPRHEQRPARRRPPRRPPRTRLLVQLILDLAAAGNLDDWGAEAQRLWVAGRDESLGVPAALEPPNLQPPPLAARRADTSSRLPARTRIDQVRRVLARLQIVPGMTGVAARGHIAHGRISSLGGSCGQGRHRRRHPRGCWCLRQCCLCYAARRCRRSHWNRL